MAYADTHTTLLYYQIDTAEKIFSQSPLELEIAVHSLENYRKMTKSSFSTKE